MLRLLAGICCLLIATVVSGPVLANDLFEVEVPVVSQSSTERAKAASMGLRKVLLRMAGSPTVVDSNVIRQAYSQAQNYIEQFHYAPYSPSARDADNPKATELLVMTFSRRVIEQLLREAGEPYWPPNRPPVFVWLVEDTDTGKALINSRRADVLKGLLQGARERGLEIRLPLLDLDDQLALPAQRLWRLDQEAILAASERYDVDTILVGRYSRTSRGEWLSTWQFWHRGANREYDLRADSAPELGQQAIHPLADHLARLYAVTPQRSESPEVMMTVAGIQHFGQYRQALDYLQALAGVTSLKLHAVRGDTLLLRLQIDGGLDTLRNSLSLDRKLQHAGQNDQTPPWLRQEEGTPERPLRYVWQGR